MKLSISKIALALTLSTAIIYPQVQANGNSHIKKSISEMAGNADLVLHGKVTAVDYRNSSSTTGSGSMPHTFVTYTVSEILAGNYTAPTITLRFMGGLDKTNGMFTSGSDMPAFDMGDEDILFVSGNGASFCPLVDCSDGRFRVISGGLQDEEGHELHSSDGDKLIKGNRKPSKIVDEQYVNGVTLGIKEIPTKDGQRPDQPNIKEPKITLPKIKDKAKDKVKAGKSVVSADAGMNFVFDIKPPSIDSEAPPVIGTPTPSSMVEEDEIARRELEGEANRSAVQGYAMEVPGLDVIK